MKARDFKLILEPVKVRSSAAHMPTKAYKDRSKYDRKRRNNSERREVE